MTQHYAARKIVLAWEQEKDGAAGYAVKYRNGHISWCPKEEFEKDNRVLGHVGQYTYEQQLQMAEMAHMDDRLQAIYDEPGELARLERDVIRLHMSILQRRIAVYANVEETIDVNELDKKPLTNSEVKVYLPMLLAQLKDFNFNKEIAEVAEIDAGIKTIFLARVMDASGALIETSNEGTVDSGEILQHTGMLVGVGVYSFAINTTTGEITGTVRPMDSDSVLEGLTFGWDVAFKEPGVLHVPV